VISQTNRGPYPARNLGVAESRGEAARFLDADDWWTRDCLEKLHAALAANPDAALSYCGCRTSVSPGHRERPTFLRTMSERTRRRIFSSPPRHPGPSRCLVRVVYSSRWVVSTLTCPSCMDYDLWLRHCLCSPNSTRTEVMAFYRRHVSGQITSANSAAGSQRLAGQTQVPARVSSLDPSFFDAPTSMSGWMGRCSKRGYDNYWRRRSGFRPKDIPHGLF